MGIDTEEQLSKALKDSQLDNENLQLKVDKLTKEVVDSNQSLNDLKESNTIQLDAIKKELEKMTKARDRAENKFKNANEEVNNLHTKLEVYQQDKGKHSENERLIE